MTGLEIRITTSESQRISLQNFCQQLESLGSQAGPKDWARLLVRQGKLLCPLGSIAELRVIENATKQVTWTGRTEILDSLGHQLSQGEWYVDGDTGHYCGAGITGGRITVAGNTGNWLGVEGTGGTIHVLGSAGDFTAASLPGHKRGVNGSCLLVNGNCGVFAGRRMRRGTLAIGGTVDHGTAWQMLAGTVVLGSTPANQIGQGMKRGTIIICDPTTELAPDVLAPNGKAFAPDSIVPAASPAGLRLSQPVWPLIRHQILQAGWSLPLPDGDHAFSRFHGLAEYQMRSEIWVA